MQVGKGKRGGVTMLLQSSRREGEEDWERNRINEVFDIYSNSTCIYIYVYIF